MRYRLRRIMAVLILLLGLAGFAPAIALGDTTPTATAPVRITTGGGITHNRLISQPAPLPRITITPSGMTNSVTGATFMARGANYIKLAVAGNGDVYHSTFEPGLYDDTLAQNALGRMHSLGYTTVRVFIDAGGSSSNDHGMGHGAGDMNPINLPYMANVAQFVLDATRAGLYILPSMDAVPSNDYYAIQIANADNNKGQYTSNISGINLWTMDTGFVAAKAEYLSQFITALKNQIGAQYLSTILAYQANNELYFESSSAPFNHMSGTVTPLNGVTYDMSKLADRQQAADASLVEYSYRLKRAITAADPNGKLTIGFFTPQAVGKSSYSGFPTYCPSNCGGSGNLYWMPGRPASLSIFGAADFIDLHLYPRLEGSGGYSLTSDLNSSEVGLFANRYIVGELGAFKPNFPSGINQATSTMLSDQKASCTIGANNKGAIGWLFWTWDAPAPTAQNLASQPLFWNMLDYNGKLATALSPASRPNPCQ